MKTSFTATNSSNLHRNFHLKKGSIYSDVKYHVNRKHHYSETEQNGTSLKIKLNIKITFLYRRYF